MIFDEWEFDIWSDLNFDELIIEIRYKDEWFGRLFVKGDELTEDRVQLEIYPKPNGDFWSVQYSEFVAHLDLAKKRLLGEK